MDNNSDNLGDNMPLNSTVYFFFGVFLSLTDLGFFGDLVAFFAGLAAGFFPAAGFLAFGFAAFFSAVGFFAAAKTALQQSFLVSGQSKDNYLILLFYSKWINGIFFLQDKHKINAVS